MLTELTHIYLYDEPSAPYLDTFELRDYLQFWLPQVEVQTRTSFAAHHIRSRPEPDQQAVSAQLADLEQGAVVVDVSWPDDPWGPPVHPDGPPLESAFELGYGTIYHSFELARAWAALIPEEESSSEQVHIAITAEHIGDFDLDDRRFHLRTIALSEPAIISTCGLVDALARPREYEFKRMQYMMVGLHEALAELEEEFADRMLEEDDPRITEILKGYVLQPVVYRLTGEPFCDDPQCRLYNSRRHEEVLRAQLTEPEFCPRHAELLRRYRDL